MYFNRKNAEQKNWRMIKKGKHFLFGCSLVFAVGAALVAPSVKADAVDAKPEASSTTEGIKPVAAEENATYAAPAVEVAPAAVAEEKVQTTQNSKEEPVVTTEKAKEADSIQAPEVTVVYNPSALTDEEKAKVVAAVKAANSAATDIQVQADGSVVVTFADGSSARLSAAQTIKDGSQVAKPRRARAAVAAPVITSNLDGKGSSATDVTVQAPAGSTVKLYNTDGVVIGEAVANAQGVATVTPTNSLPVGEITATATPAGGSESPKSAPVTATRPTLTTVEGGVSRGNDSDNTQLLVTKSHITVYPGESVKIGVVAVSQEMENFSVPKNPDGVKGLLPTGVYLKTAGTETYKRRNNGYGGTVAWDQPAGDTVVTFAVRSKNNVVVTRDLKVTVLELTKKLDAVPGEKVEVADLNNVSEDEKNKIIAATKKANASFPPGTLYNVDQRGNLVVTYPDKSTDKIDASYLVTPSNKPADTNKPAGQAPEITSDLSGKASTPTDVTVKAEPGSTVKLYNNDGVVIGEAVANDQGIATISPINSLPEGQITATATPAGGSESPKSTPITATRAEKPEVDGGVSRGNDNTQLLVTRSHITVYPGESVNVGVTAASNAIQNFWVPKNPDGVKGLLPTGYYISTAGTDTIRQRSAGYGGTVDWDQPAGDTVVTFAVRSKKNAVVTRDLKVTVLELTKKLDAVPGEKVEVANPNNVSEDEKNKIIAATTKANASFPPGTTYSVDEKGNLVITYPDKSTDKIAAAYLVTPAARETDKYTPTAKNQTVKQGETPDAKNSIANAGELPSGTSFAYKTPVDTATKGEKDAIVVVTYPDKSTDEVPVKVTVKDPRSDADKNDPKAKAQDIYKGSTPDAKGSIDNADDLPYGTSFAYKTPVDTETPGEKDATVVVTYPDGSKDEVPVKVTVEDPDKTSAENNTPTAKDQTVKVGEEPKAEASIGNFDKLPKGTKAEFKTPVDTTTPGEKDAIVVVTYPDSLTYEVPVKVTVKDPRSDADKNTPVAKDQSVKPGSTPNAKDSIGNVGDLPEGTTFEFKTPVDTTTEGDKDAIVVVTYPDGSKDEVPVKVTVKDPRSDADKNTPVAKDQSVKPGDKPNAKDSIGNVGDLPSGTKFEYKTPVDTTTEGDKDAIVVVTYPDGSKDEVPVKVTVKDPRSDADKNTPVAKDQSVKPGSTPNAKDSIGNVGDLPSGTKFEYKTPVDTTTEGDKDAIVVVTYPDGSKDEVPVKVTVKDPRSDADKNTPVAKDQSVKPGDKPNAKDSIGNVGDLPSGTKFEYKTPVDTTTEGDKDAIVVVTYPDGSKDEVPVKVTVKDPRTDADKNTPVAKDQSVKPGSTPNAKDSIGNVGDLPSGTKFEYKTPVDTTTEGDKDAIVVVTYPDGSKDEVPVKVTVKDPRSDADKNTPVAKDQSVKPGDKPNAKDSIGNVGDLPEGTTFEFKTPVDTTTEGDKDATVVVTYPDGSKDEVPVKVTVKDPRSDADKNTPVAKDQSVKPGDKPNAKDSIGNVGDLPEGTTFEFKTPVDTTTEGDKDATVVVTYPDGSKDEVPVKVTVKDPRTDADKNTPVAKDQSVKPGSTPNAKDSIGNVGDLPSGTKFEYKTPVDTTTEGEKDAIVVVTYPDGSKDEVPVKVTVKEPSESATDADKYTPKAKAQDVNKGETPDAKGSIDNVGDLPEGTKFEYKTPVDTTTPGDKDATVVVTYPDGSKDEVPVKVTVKDPSTDADKNTPVAKGQTVKPGDKPNAKDSIGNVGDLPSGTKFEYKTPVDTTTEGDKDAIVVVTYPDGSKDEVPVKVTVKDPRTDADKNTPVAKDQSVKPGDKPNAKDSIGNVGDLPSGTKFEYKTPVDTTTEGDKDAIVVVTYPDGSKDEVPVKVTVKDPRTDADKNTPIAKDQTVKPGETPNAKDSIGNVGELPEGTTFEYKTPVDTTTPGDKGTTVVVTYPDGSKDEVPVKVTVKDPRTDADKNTPVAKDQSVKPGDKPNAKDSIGNVGDLPSGTKFEYKTPVDTTTEGDKDAIVVVTYPDGSKDEVPVKVTVKDPRTDADKNTPIAKDQTVKPGETPNAKDSIGNVGELPEGTTFEYKTPVDTTTPGDKGTTVVVTYPDGSKDEVPVKVTVKDPDKTSDAENNTPTAKDQTVKQGETPDAKNSIGNVGELPEGTTFEFKTPVDTTTPGDKGTTVVVTYPDGSKDEVPVKVTVKDSSALTQPEITADLTGKAGTKTPVEVTADPGTKVELFDKDGNKIGEGVTGEDGKASITPTVEIPAGPVTAKASKDGKTSDESAPKVATKDPAITPVVNPSALTDAEKAKVADEVKKANPTASKVEVGNDGTATVTFPDGSVAVLTPEKTVKEADSNGVKNPAITPVVNPSALTDAEKAKVADEVKKANPTASKVEVGNDGTATVTFPDGSVAVLTPEKTVKEADSNGVKNPAITPVVNPSALTDAEKAKVADEVKKANPTASKVEVGNDGTATVTFPDGSVAVLTPEKTVKEADSNGVKNPAITPVVNPSALTDAEKAKVADEVKKANPTASKVEVGNDGTATVTFPDGSVAVLTPEKTVKEADSNGVKNPAITPVVNPSALTDAEKAKVADEVKKANPTASKVEVGNDGTATVTFPDGSVAVLTPEKTVKEADSNGVKNPAITPVVNPSALTDAEKAKVADEVKKANPTASKVEVGNDGTATVTFPDGSVAVLTPEKTVKEADSNGVKNPAITPVVNPSALTDAEKAKVADEVKKANPTASKVEVGNDGTATVTFPDGSVAVLTPEKTVKEADSNGVKNPAITLVVNPSALTDAEKAKVADEVKKANPTASKVEVGNDGTATVTFPDGSVAVLTPEKTVKKATKESSANPASKKAGAKELPNTGTEQSNASVGLALLAAATGGLLFAKKRKEEE